MHTRCADKRIRAAAVGPSMAGIVYTDRGQCHFTTGLPTEVIPVDVFNRLKSSGALGRAPRRRRRTGARRRRR